MPTDSIYAPMACTVVEVSVTGAQAVHAGQTLLVIEAMKMEHEIRAEGAAHVVHVAVRAGDVVAEGELLLTLDPTQAAAAAAADPASPAAAATPGALRGDLQEVLDRHALTLDAASSAGRCQAPRARHAHARARTSPTCAIPAASSNTARSRSPRSARRRSLDDLIAQHAGRRHGDRHRQHQRRAVRTASDRAAS